MFSSKLYCWWKYLLMMFTYNAATCGCIIYTMHRILCYSFNVHIFSLLWSLFIGLRVFLFKIVFVSENVTCRLKHFWILVTRFFYWENGCKLEYNNYGRKSATSENSAVLFGSNSGVLLIFSYYFYEVGNTLIVYLWFL